MTLTSYLKFPHILLLMTLITSTCGVTREDRPSSTPDLATTTPLIESSTPSASLINKTNSVTPTTGLSLPGTITPENPQCYFNWADQPLPELSNQVKTALKAANLPLVSAVVYVHGENCTNSQNNEVVYFSPMETVYRTTFQVETLTDTENLGNMLETIMIVLDGFPMEAILGPNPS